MSLKLFFLLFITGGALFIIACNSTGLSRTPRATFSQLACLDRNGDLQLNGGDVTDASQAPDFNGDGKRDEQDAAFLRGVDIPLDATRTADACKNGSNTAPEYLVARGYFKDSDVDCSGGKQPVLILGVGGGVVNLKDRGDAAGIRSIVDGLQRAYADRQTQTLTVLAGPAIVGASNVHSAMEQWLTSAVKIYLDRFPCLRAVLVGHSNGAISVDVVAARLEAQYAQRFIEVVDVDRVEVLYSGDVTSRPTTVPVFNIYEQNGILPGAPFDAPNVENWNASDQQAPQNGDKGGPLAPVNHTTIDNSKSVKQRIVDSVMSRSGG
ncbi:MAG: hypothetical protein HYX50_00250 [Chloroflexi bacterium]|nr:hypothetical protein [Chloroflexota bacterium]